MCREDADLAIRHIDVFATSTESVADDHDSLLSVHDERCFLGPVDVRYVMHVHCTPETLAVAEGSVDWMLDLGNAVDKELAAETLPVR
jgi:hypothetical protein